MTRSGEWIGTQALNAMRHRMGSRDAVDTVAARRPSQQFSGHATQVRAARNSAARHDGQPWLLAETAKLHVGIMAGLAGFSFTGIVLLVGLAHDRSDMAAASFDTVLVMFIVSFIYYIGNAFLISYLPNPDTSRGLVPHVHFSLASTIEYRTLFVSWFALLPLLQAYGLNRAADLLAVLLPLSLAVGSVILAMAADGLGLMRLKETYFAAAVGTGVALACAGVVRLVAPDASTAASTLYVTIAIFCLNGVGFALAALTALLPRYPRLARFYERHGRNIVIADIQATMIALAFLWLAVIGVI